MDGLPQDNGPAMSSMSDSDCMGGVHRFAYHPVFILSHLVQMNNVRSVSSVQCIRTFLHHSLNCPGTCWRAK